MLRVWFKYVTYGLKHVKDFCERSRTDGQQKVTATDQFDSNCSFVFTENTKETPISSVGSFPQTKVRYLIGDLTNCLLQ